MTCQGYLGGECQCRGPLMQAGDLSGKDDVNKISTEEATKRIVWLVCWFLKGVVGSDVY